MKGVRFTKAERAYIEERIYGRQDPPIPSETKLADSILEKFARADLGSGKKSTAIPVAAALEAFRGVLGKRLVTPPAPGPGWYAQISKRLGDLGLTVGDCATIAKVAGEGWRGYIKADSLIRQAEVLLQEAQLPLPYEAVNQRRIGSDMEDL